MSIDDKLKLIYIDLVWWIFSSNYRDVDPNLSFHRYGAGCKFWRAPDENHPETKGQYFVADQIEYRLRPIRGWADG